MLDTPKQVLIIGGGFGGLSLARELASQPVDVTLVDRENHHLFQPLLYQVATAALAPEQIAVPIRSVLHARPACRVLMDEACSVDFDTRSVRLRSGSQLRYDYLVLAAGARTSFLGHDEEWQRHTRGLKSLRDALGIRQQILERFERANREADAERRREMLRFVVVGGGPLGVELAGAISELGRTVLARDYTYVCPADVHVTLIEMAPRVLPQFSPKLSARAQTQLEELGVEVRLETSVEDVHSDAVVTNAGLLKASLVCWAPGVEAVRLAGEIGVEQGPGGRLRVEPDCSVPGHPEVFAIGDMAAFMLNEGDPPLPALAPVAMQQARFVARAIARDRRGKPRGTFAYKDKGMLATIGRSRAVVQRGRMQLSGLVAWLGWLLVHLYFLIGFRNRVLVMIDWFWSYVTFKRGARLMTGDPERSAKRQARAYQRRTPSAVPRGE